MRRAARAPALAASAWLVLALAPAGCARNEVLRGGGDAGNGAETAPPDTRELAETIRKMRDAKESEESVRVAIGTLRRERDARVVASAAPPPAGRGPGALGAAGHDSSEQRKYARALYERIYRSWILIAAAPREGRTGAELFVRIKIGKDGRVTNMRIERTSGYRVFDDSVLRAIKRATPLPVPPETLRGGEDDYEVSLRFRTSGVAP